MGLMQGHKDSMTDQKNLEKYIKIYIMYKSVSFLLHSIAKNLKIEFLCTDKFFLFFLKNTGFLQKCSVTYYVLYLVVVNQRIFRIFSMKISVVPKGYKKII